jgi:hypothetical protein
VTTGATKVIGAPVERHVAKDKVLFVLSTAKTFFLYLTSRGNPTRPFMKTLFFKTLIVLFFLMLKVDSVKGEAHQYCPENASITNYYNAVEKIINFNYEKERIYDIDGVTITGKLIYPLLESFNESCFTSFINNIDYKSLSTKDLHTIYLTAVKVTFYIPDDFLIQAIERILTTKKEKGEFIGGFLSELHGIYIKARLFDKAYDLQSHSEILTYNALPDFIQIIDSPLAISEYTIYDGSYRRNVITDNNLLDKNQIVVIASPNCSPSQRFLNWLKSSSDISVLELFRNKSLFLIPPSYNLHDNIFFDSEISEIDSNFINIRRKKDWKDIKNWDTPIFYLFKDGKLVKQIVGWSKESPEKELITALIEFGYIE